LPSSPPRRRPRSLSGRRVEEAACGDGLLDVGTWNETTGQWRIVASGATTLTTYGTTGDIPAGGQ